MHALLNPRPWACLVLASAALLTDARAGRPLVSETADALDNGLCEIEAAVGRLSASGMPSVRDWSGIFSCGVPGQTQLALGYGQARAAGVRAEALLLGGKTTLRMPADGTVGYGLAYSLVGAKAPGDSMKFDETNLVGLVTVELAKGLLGHANLGWSRSRAARQSTTTWSLGVETTGDFVIAGDLFGDDRNKPGASLGVGHVLGSGFSINAAVGWLFETPRVRQISLGAKLVF